MLMVLLDWLSTVTSGIAARGRIWIQDLTSQSPKSDGSNDWAILAIIMYIPSDIKLFLL